MSYPTIKAAIVARIQTIDALAGGVLAYEPSAIQRAPCAYLLLDAGQVRVAGQRSLRTWRTTVRVVIARQHALTGEQTLDALVDDLIRVIDEDPTAGGVISSGWQRVTDIQTGYIDFASVSYRVMDATVESLEKMAYGS